MKLFAPAIVLFSLCAAKIGVSALEAPDTTDAIEGYEIVVPEWEVEVFPGQPPIKLSGTIQEVHSELLRQNPDWNTHFPANTTETPKVEERGFDVSGYFCGGRWQYCSGIAIEDGIDYLRRVRGLPSLGGGPGKCGRVSCSFKAAIYWCNDDRTGKTLQGGFDDIADGAKYLYDRCKLGIRYPAVAGQNFAKSNWNVIIRRDTNRC